MKWSWVGFLGACLLAGQFLFGQTLPVHEEPFHRPVLHIPDQVRVLEVKVAPGDTSLFHVHAHDMVFYTLQGTSMWLKTPEGESRTVTLPTGYTLSYLDYEEEPFTHKIANVGDQALHILAVENLSADRHNEVDSLPDDRKSRFLLQDRRFQVREVGLKAGRGTTIRLAGPSLAFLATGGPVEVRAQSTGGTNILTEPGNWYWNHWPVPLVLKNKGAEEVKVIIVQPMRL